MELEIIKWGVLAVLSGMGWFMKKTITTIEEKQAAQGIELQRIREEYLHKNDFREFKAELRGMFEEIRQNIRELKPHQ